MKDERIDELVAAAVGKSLDAWAAEHPSLAAVIDRIVLTQRATQSLRDDPAFAQAQAAYRRDRDEMNFLTQLADLAGPVISRLLGL